MVHDVTMAKTHQTSNVSCLLLVLGYVILWLGVTSREWRREIGYLYGLWVRCDDNICTHYVTEFNSYIILVRCGMVLSLLMMTVTMVCLVLEKLQTACSVRKHHVDTTHRLACVTAGLGEIVAAASIGLYGCKTVMSRDRYPVLLGGFALTGCGIIVSLLGNILKVMGPVSSWATSFSSLVPSHDRSPGTHTAVYSGGSEPCSADSCETHLGSRSFGGEKNRGRRDRVQSVILCCHRKSRYNSVPSSCDSTADVNYRHYEEISFDDMPPPPLELLRPISGDYSLAMCSPPHEGDENGSHVLRNAIVRNAAHYPRGTIHQHNKTQSSTVEQMRSNDHHYLNQNQYLPPPPPPPLPFTDPKPQSKPVPKARHQHPNPSGSRAKKRAPSPRHQEPTERDIKTRTLNHYTLSGARTQQLETSSSRYKTLPCRTSNGQARGSSGQTGNARCIGDARTGSYHGKNIGHHV